MTGESLPRNCCFSKKYADLLSALAHADQNQRTALLRKADLAFVLCICEVALNTLHGTIPIKGKAKTNSISKAVRKRRKEKKDFDPKYWGLFTNPHRPSLTHWQRVF